MDGIVTYVGRWAGALWAILVEAGVWLLAGFVVAGLLHALVSRAWIERQLGGRSGVWKAALLGAPIPLCSCSVIPFAAGIRRQGASRGASASFAISSPEIDVPAVGLTWGLMGPAMAIARPIAAFVSALGAGLLIDRFARGNGRADRVANGGDGAKAACCASAAPVVKACCCSGAAEEAGVAVGAQRAAGEGAAGGSCCAAQGGTGSTRWGVRALRFSFVTLPRDLGVWMSVGLGLSALIVVLVPAGWIEENLTGSGVGEWASRGLMLLIGMPLYVCATSSTPLVAALVSAGLSPGAGLVFLLAGPATNPATMAWVLKDLGGRALAIYLAVIGVVAFGAGTLVDLALPRSLFEVAGGVAREHAHAGIMHQVAGGVLAALLVAGMVGRIRWRARGEARVAQGVA